MTAISFAVGTRDGSGSRTSLPSIAGFCGPSVQWRASADRRALPGASVAVSWAGPISSNFQSGPPMQGEQELPPFRVLDLLTSLDIALPDLGENDDECHKRSSPCTHYSI